MANKLDKEYSSIKATKALLKLNPEISVDQVKGYDRRARTSPFIMEHVKIIQSLTDENEENEKLKAQVVALQASEAKLTQENEELQCQYELAIQIDNKEIACLKEEIDDLKYDMENELYTEDQVEVLREEWIGSENKELRKEIIDLKAENEKLTGWLATAHENADAKIHEEAAGMIIEENDKLKAENEKLKEASSENKGLRKENADIVAYQEKCGVVCSQAIFDGMIDTIKEYKDAYYFMSIVSDEATGVYHFLGERACEETANKLISTGYMEREEFKEFNPNWEDHHN